VVVVYANISVEAKPDTFDSGWPPETRRGTLDGFYERIGKTMQVGKVPKGQSTSGLLTPSCSRRRPSSSDTATGSAQLDLAVTFDNECTYDQPDPHNVAKSKLRVDALAQTQGICVHVGDCDIGCPVNARDTLDLNYIAIAKDTNRADVKPPHIAHGIAPIAGGYQVTYDEIRQRRADARFHHLTTRHCRRRFTGIHGASPPVPVGRHAARPQHQVRVELEQQRRLPDARDSLLLCGESDTGADYHRGG